MTLPQLTWRCEPGEDWFAVGCEARGQSRRGAATADRRDVVPPASPVHDVPAAAAAASRARRAKGIRDTSAPAAIAWPSKIGEGRCPVGCLARGQSRPGRLSQPIERTAHAQGTPVHDVQINHRCTDVCMTEQGLHGPDVVAVFEQMRRETVAKSMATRVLRETSPPNCLGHSLLDHRFVQVKTRGWTPSRIPTDPRRRKPSG